MLPVTTEAGRPEKPRSIPPKQHIEEVGQIQDNFIFFNYENLVADEIKLVGSLQFSGYVLVLLIL